MDKSNLDDSLKAALGELQEYLNLQVKYNKMLLAKKMGEVFSRLAIFLIVAGIGGFLILFLSLAFVAWFNQHSTRPYMGELIVAGFYLLLIILLIVFRKQVFYSTMRKLFGEVMFSDDEDSAAFREAFSSDENLDIRIRKFKRAIKKREEKLGKKYDDLSKNLTLTNIIQSVVRSAYNTFITTSNIAKTAMSLFKSITRSKKNRSKKKKRPPELEEGQD
jgi:Na+/melibiose symporter-like transporter